METIADSLSAFRGLVLRA